MLMEVYYEHYRENCKGAYWEEPISIPYGVYDRDRKARNSFYGYLKHLRVLSVSLGTMIIPLYLSTQNLNALV